MKNIIVITGGAGFVGSNLILLLLKKTKYKIISIDNYSSGNKKIYIKCVPVTHGSIKALSFIINNNCAYAPDVNKIHNMDLKHFKNLKYFIVDCLRIKKHPSHYNLNEVLNLIKIIKPKKTILTNLHTDLDYNYLLKILPNNVIPAHDGLSLNL